MRSVLFEIFGVRIYAFGAAICLSFMFAFWLTRYLVARERRDPLLPLTASDDEKKALLESIYDFGFGCMIGAIAGARIFHILRPSYIQIYLDDPIRILKVWEGGLVFYGGFIGGFAVCLFMVLRKKLRPWSLGDLAAPGIAFAYAIGRWGCFLNGCCYGAPVEGGIVMRELRDGVPRHPTQLYEAGAGFLIGFVLLWLLPRKTFRGQVFFLFVILYAVERFTVEFWRDDPRGGAGPFTTSQWVALITVPFAAGMLAWLRRNQPVTDPAA
ncbi:MAG: prolipoprotein diacylglyceryl transferase [Candidatus Brocadiae bacterium]|nr:prolipoprotein diacylglyceryl transferase [Candidatus Brocadiia bacterium]